MGKERLLAFTDGVLAIVITIMVLELKAPEEPSFEALGAMLLSEINIAYYQTLMQGARAAIAAGTFSDFRETTRAGWARGDIAPR